MGLELIDAALRNLKIGVGLSNGMKYLFGLVGFPFAPASSIGSLAAISKNSIKLMWFFRITFIPEILLWNFALRGGFLSFLQWAGTGLVADNPYQWSSYYSLLNGN